MVHRFRIPPPPRLARIVEVAIALGLALLVSAVQWAYRGSFEGMFSVLPLLGVAIAAWAGGVLPGFIAVAITGASGYLLLRTSADPAHVAGAPVSIAVFIPAAAVIAWIGGAVRVGFRERERAAATLESSEARERARAEELQAIMDAVPAAVLIAHDREARRITGSRTAYELFRIAPGANISKTGEQPPSHFRVLKNGSELPPQELPTQAAARTGQCSRDVEFEVVFDNGTRRTLLGNAQPLFDEEHRPRGSVSAFVDVTKLSDAVRMRDSFLSMASHELKTPLTALQLQVETFLRASGRIPPPLAKSAEAIRRQVARLTALVNTLLDVSRVNEARLRLELEPVDLSALVREVVSRFAAESESSRSPVTIDAGSAVCGYWDRLRIEQVVTNLLSNALKYGEGKPVTVRVEADGEIARMLVIDRGMGIAVGEQGRIFERFERGRAARGYGGFGLGLWIVREIVTALGGRIEVESAVGSGSTFCVELPIGDRSAARLRGCSPS